MNIKTIAIDPGYGSTKVRADGKTTTIHSAVARIKEVGLAGVDMKTASQAHTIRLGWETFAIGDGAWNWGEPLTNRDYSALTSPERRALIFGALAQSLESGDYEIDTTVFGLPVPLLMDETQGQAIMNGLKAYKNEHCFATSQGEYKLTIQKLKVLPQPVGA